MQVATIKMIESWGLKRGYGGRGEREWLFVQADLSQREEETS